MKEAEWIGKKLFFLGGFILVLFIAFSCKGPSGKNDPQSQKMGVMLWQENCNRCHNYRPATQYSDTEWDVIMHHMRLRANLTATETRKIAEFMKSSNGQ